MMLDDALWRVFSYPLEDSYLEENGVSIGGRVEVCESLLNHVKPRKQQNTINQVFVGVHAWTLHVRGVVNYLFDLLKKTNAWDANTCY